MKKFIMTMVVALMMVTCNVSVADVDWDAANNALYGMSDDDREKCTNEGLDLFVSKDYKKEGNYVLGGPMSEDDQIALYDAGSSKLDTKKVHVPFHIWWFNQVGVGNEHSMESMSVINTGKYKFYSAWQLVEKEILTEDQARLLTQYEFSGDPMLTKNKLDNEFNEFGRPEFYVNAQEMADRFLFVDMKNGEIVVDKDFSNKVAIASLKSIDKGVNISLDDQSISKTKYENLGSMYDELFAEHQKAINTLYKSYDYIDELEWKVKFLATTINTSSLTISDKVGDTTVIDKINNDSLKSTSVLLGGDYNSKNVDGTKNHVPFFGDFSYFEKIFFTQG